MRVFQLIFFTQSCDETEMRVGTSSLNLSFHVVTYMKKGGTFEGILSEEHEVEENSQCPNVD